MVQLRELASIVALFLFFLLLAFASVFVAEIFRVLGKAIGALLLGVA
ncbi:MAG: hypothetical protein RMJ28_00800 [Nitrososphaerota archaeon]|nr:hypothetical protein [Candidatus Calditenuaceae archaeon]MDW8072771.1 hypothetical protein [Nitrososphaerota archaeon]